jgi:hypothetical protein
MERPGMRRARESGRAETMIAAVIDRDAGSVIQHHAAHFFPTVAEKATVSSGHSSNRKQVSVMRQ